MTEDEHLALRKRVTEMSEDERLALDPICEALCGAMKEEFQRRGVMASPNRVTALACVDLAWAWSEYVLSQE